MLGSHKHAESVVQVDLLPYNIVLLLEHGRMYLGPGKKKF